MKSGDEIIRELLSGIEPEHKFVAFDKATSWSKLDDRLGKPERKGIPILFKWAAVLLLGIAIITALMPGDTENRVTKEHTAIVTPGNPQPGPTGKIVPQELRPLKELSVESQRTKGFTEISVPIVDIVIPEEQEENYVAKEVEKEPYKIIHINELNRQEYIEKTYKKGHYTKARRLYYGTQLPGDNHNNNPYIPEADFFENQP